MSTIAILNPNSGRGKAAQVWASVRAHLKNSVPALETRAPGHAIELTREAIKSGARTIIAGGGDGTINEVVNGFFEHEKMISSETTLAIIPHGTGCDFRRVLKLPLDFKKAAAVIHSGAPRLIDLMKVRYASVDGRHRTRYAINITSFGMGGVVASRANRSSKVFGGKIAFIVATLRTAASYSGNSVALQLDNSKTVETKITNVAVGNGQYHGAGMWVCPGAAIDDGWLDVTVIRYLSVIELVKNLPVLYNGGIYSNPKVESYRAKRVTADSKERTLIEIDGEPLGHLPVEVSVLTRAIRVLTA